MSDPQSSHVSVQCECGKKLKVPAGAAGRKARCPACQRTFVVPHVAADEQATDEPDSALYDLAAQEQSVEAPLSAAGRPCPRCKAPMQADARLCVSCGYDTLTGHVAAAPDTHTRTPLAIGRLAGTFLLGCTLSAVAALVGAAAWAIIAIKLDYQIGWVAWGIGLLAGLGMHWGFRNASRLAGIVAAGMAFSSIMVAKVIIFVFLMYVVFTGNTDSIAGQRLFLTLRVADEVLVEREAFSEQEREEQWESACEEAERRIDQMSDDQVRAEVAEYREQEARLAEALDGDGKESDQFRLADHHAGRRANAMGLSYEDDKREQIFEEELARVRELSDEQLAAAIAQLDEWEETGKWSDSQYIRDYLICEWAYDTIERESHAQDAEADSVSPEQWQTAYQDAVARVDAMSFDQQVEQVRQIEREQQEQLAKWREEAEQAGGEEAGSGGIVSFFFSAMFVPMDALFFLFAVATAYKVGAGGSGGTDG